MAEPGAALARLRGYTEAVDPRPARAERIDELTAV
jgi:hypothetical protein